MGKMKIWYDEEGDYLESGFVKKERLREKGGKQNCRSNI